MTVAASSCTFDHLSLPEDMVSCRNPGSKHMIITSAWAVSSLLLRNRWRPIVLGDVTTTISCFQSCMRAPVGKLITCAQIKVQMALLSIALFGGCIASWGNSQMAIGVHVMAMQRKTSISDLEKEHAYLESWTVDRKLNYKIKTRLYNTLVMPTATY